MSAFLLTADLTCSSRVAAAAERTGVDVRTVSSVDSLLDRLTSQTADLVILDLNLPALDVVGTVERVRQALPSTKVVAFGPHVHEAKLAAAVKAGCDQVVSRGQFHAQLDALLNHISES